MFFFPAILGCLGALIVPDGAYRAFGALVFFPQKIWRSTFLIVDFLSSAVLSARGSVSVSFLRGFVLLVFEYVLGVAFL